MLTPNQWIEEAEFCEEVRRTRDFHALFNGPTSFAEYCAMQARFARKEGCPKEATRISAAGEGIE